MKMATPSALTANIKDEGASLPTSAAHNTAPKQGLQNYLQGPSIQRRLGLQESERLAGPLLVENLKKLECVNPALGRSLIENGFGNNSTSLAYREWAMVIIAILVAMGDTTDQLQVYLQGALKHGATEKEIIDLINLTAGFTGAPRAVNGIRRISETLFGTRDVHLRNVEETVVRLHDHSTLVRDSQGGGVPVVLIHALSMDCNMWKDIFPRLASGGRVISV